MRRMVAASAAAGLILGGVSAHAGAPQSVDPVMAPPPGILIAQVDLGSDPDLQGEESLADLMAIEYEKDKLSITSAIALSLIPGGGYGLLYAGKRAQAAVPFGLSIIGYSVAGAYFVGAFDTDELNYCSHVRDGRVDMSECGLAGTPVLNQEDDPRAEVPNKQYWATGGDYSIVSSGEDFDGKKTGLMILAGTYITTTLLGSIWSANVVSDHNHQLQRDIESTAQAPTVKPIIAFDGQAGHIGLAVEF